MSSATSDEKKDTTSSETTKIPYVNYTLPHQFFRCFLFILLFPWSIFRVHLIKEGEIGLILNAGKPEVLKPGWHVLLSPATKFVKACKITDPIIENGPLKILNIPINYKVVYSDYSEEKTKFSILEPGRHCLENPNYGLISFNDDPLFYTGLVRLSLTDGRDKKEGLEADTNNSIRLIIKADVVYQITLDVLLKNINPSVTNIKNYINQTTKSALVNAFASRDYTKTKTEKNPEDKKPSSEEKNKTNSVLREDIVLEAKTEANKSLNPIGIKIENIFIESLEIRDEKIRLLFEDQAQLALKTTATTANIAAINENHLAEAENKAALIAVQASAEAKAIITKAEAEANATKINLDILLNTAKEHIGREAKPSAEFIENLTTTYLQVKALTGNGGITVTPNAMVLSQIGLAQRA